MGLDVKQSIISSLLCICFSLTNNARQKFLTSTINKYKLQYRADIYKIPRLQQYLNVGCNFILTVHNSKEKKKYLRLTPEQELRDGVKILSPYLEPLGFKFQLKETGKGSGGHFAYGHFYNNGGLFSKTRKIELHFRWSLGLVSYFVGDLALSHQDYVDLLSKHGQNKYPNFSDNPQDAFHCLLWDLQHLLNDFTENNAVIFKEKAPKRINEIKQQQKIINQADKKIYSGDQRLIDQAKAEFKKGNYLQVDKLRQQLQYPELLSATEKKLFELNDERKKNYSQQ